MDFLASRRNRVLTLIIYVFSIPIIFGIMYALFSNNPNSPLANMIGVALLGMFIVATVYLTAKW